MEYELQFGVVRDHLDLLIQGTIATLWLSTIGALAGFGVGTLGALMRRSSIKVLNGIATAYVEFIRNTPFLIQLFFLFFGLPSIGLRLSPEQAALLAMTINFGAYATEIVRAGIEGIPKGQIEAGRSLGLSQVQVFLQIVLIQALDKIYPSLAAQFILLMLGSSVISQISAEELTFQANFIQSRTFRAFEIYFAITLIYLGLSLFFTLLFSFLRARLFRFRSADLAR